MISRLTADVGLMSVKNVAQFMSPSMLAEIGI